MEDQQNDFPAKGSTVFTQSDLLTLQTDVPTVTLAKITTYLVIGSVKNVKQKIFLLYIKC